MQKVKIGIKYSWNDGYINIDNPKLAARYFLNAIDRVSSIKRKISKEFAGTGEKYSHAKQIIQKPFEKESELAALKKECFKTRKRNLYSHPGKTNVKQEYKPGRKVISSNEAPV